jgi:hypothetical protein
MRPRTGTQPITLEPSRVIEIMAVARDYDEKLKALQQDLFRLETKLRVERKWKWPVRAACVVLGVAGLAASQNEGVRAGVAGQFTAMGRAIEAAGNTSLTALIVTVAVLCGAIYILKIVLRKPTPEQQARKLMEQFAQRNGVAAYVFADDGSTDDEAAAIGALTRPENKTLRQRHFNASHRTLASRMTRLLHRIEDDASEPMLH